MFWANCWQEENPEASAFFIKLPPVVPMIKNPAKAGSQDVKENSKRPRVSKGVGKLYKLNELPPGLMGKMLVYKSGAVKLKLGNTLYDVRKINCKMLIWVLLSVLIFFIYSIVNTMKCLIYLCLIEKLRAWTKKAVFTLFRTNIWIQKTKWKQGDNFVIKSKDMKLKQKMFSQIENPKVEKSSEKGCQMPRGSDESLSKF